MKLAGIIPDWQFERLAPEAHWPLLRSLVLNCCDDLDVEPVGTLTAVTAKTAEFNGVPIFDDEPKWAVRWELELTPNPQNEQTSRSTSE